MAADMKHIRSLLLLACLLPAAHAETLADPTRQPAEVSAPLAQGANTGASALQSIIISPLRRAAMINGQMVELGAKQGDSRLVEVNETGVVLQGPQGAQVLPLYPGVSIRRKAAMASAIGDDKRPAQMKRTSKAAKVKKSANKAKLEESK